MADEFESLADRAWYYRRIARLIRSRASLTQSAEARADLHMLASDYEILAEHAERCGRPTKPDGTIAVHPSDRDFALLAIKAPEGTMIAQPGDWIIRGVKGELYPCKPDIFGATYEPVVATSFKAR